MILNIVVSMEKHQMRWYNLFSKKGQKWLVRTSLVETTLVEFVVDDADFYVIKFDSRRFSIPDDGFHSDYSGGEIRVEFSKLERVIEILKSL